MNKAKTTILVAEDESDLLDLYKEILSGEGRHVVGVGIVRDLAIALENQKYEIIVLDLQLKSENTERIIRQLRENSKSLNHATTILVASANVNDISLINIKRHVRGILLKPFSLDTLKERVVNLLQKDSSK